MEWPLGNWNVPPRTGCGATEAQLVPNLMNPLAADEVTDKLDGQSFDVL